MNNKFNLYFVNEYIDDGLTMFSYKYISEYMDLIVKNYKMANISINYYKSCIIMNTPHNVVQDYVQRYADKMGMKCNFVGNLKYLGVPYGRKQFIIEFMSDKLKKLIIKLNHVLLINNYYVKHNILRKLYDYNKIIYLLKMVDKYEEWMNGLMQIHNIIVRNIIIGVTMNETIMPQIHVSQHWGGFGVRAPDIYINLQPKFQH